MRVAPEVSHERMLRRARSAEAGVSLGYHRKLHALHERAIAELQAEGKVIVKVIDTAGMTDAEVGAAVMKAYKAMYVC